MKKIDPDDPKLTAYALGELDADEHAAMEAALEAQPECRALVDEIRQTAALLSTSLANEPCSVGEKGACVRSETALEVKSDQSAATAAALQTSAVGSERIVPLPRRKTIAIAAGIAASIVVITIWQAGSGAAKRRNDSRLRAANVRAENPSLLLSTQVVHSTAHSTNVSRGFVANAAPGTNTVSAARLTLQEVPLSQVLDLYENLSGRTVLQPNNLPQIKLNIRSEADLSRKDAVAALDTILAMNQLTMIPQGQKFVKVVAQAQAITQAKQFNDSAVPEAAKAQQSKSDVYTITPDDPRGRVEVGTMAPYSGVTVSRTDTSLFVHNNNGKYRNSSQTKNTTVAAGPATHDSDELMLLGETVAGGASESKRSADSIRDQQKRNWGLSASASSTTAGSVYSLNSVGIGGKPPIVPSTRFSPDGTTVITASAGEQIRLWDAKTGKEWTEPRRGIIAYAPFVENTFQSVVQQPLSTFSIDVDTASYANVRRFLNQNQRPPREAVRIEEMINYFSYNYAPPKGEEPFAASIEVAGCPWKAEHRLVRVALQGREMPQSKRPPGNLVFLIDISGSMQPAERLPLIKQGLRMLVKKMNEHDRVAIVVYASTSGVRLPSTSCAEKEKILAAIDALEAGGSTNGGEGIQQAYATARENFIKGGINRVVLCTDGDFNVGITDQSELVRLIQQQAISGVFLSALGVGTDNFKDALMQKLADNGNGNYHYIDALEEAQKVLIEQMNGTLVTIAKDVKIQIEFNPAQVSAYRLVGYEKRMLRKEDFNNDKKDAGEIGAGHAVTAFYEIAPAGRAGARPVVDALKYQPTIAPASYTANEFSNELFTLKLRYKQPDGNTSKLVEFSVADSGGSYGKASADFKFATAVAAFGMILRDSEYKGSASFDGVLELAEESKGADAGGYRAEFINLVKKAKELK